MPYARSDLEAKSSALYDRILDACEKLLMDEIPNFEVIEERDREDLIEYFLENKIQKSLEEDIVDMVNTFLA